MPLAIALSLFVGGLLGNYAGRLEGQTVVTIVDGKVMEVRQGMKNKIDPDGLPDPLYRDVHGEINARCESCEE
jgi:hypothetical protein